VSAGEATFTRAERARDLAGRVLGAALALLFFAPGFCPGAVARWVSYPFDFWEESAWDLAALTGRRVVASGFVLPIEAYRDPLSARVVEIELVLALWTAYFAAALALVFAPRRWRRARRVLAGAPLGLLATLVAIDALSSAVTRPQVLAPASLPTPWVYVPGVVFMAWAWATLRGSRVAGAIGLVLGALGLIFVPLGLAVGGPPFMGGVLASFVAASVGLILASSGASPRRVAEADA
jgi:hypothetical protein